MNNKRWLLALLILSAAIVFLCDQYIPASAHTPSLASNKIIRFHVIANSDSPQDQALKLKVRDRILDEIYSKFKNVADIVEERQIIKNNLSYIEAIANDEIKKYGEPYKAKVYFGNYDFPTKVYGEMVFPAGTYEALKVVIGAGHGANWWCVMFPPLCFIDTGHGVVPEAKQQHIEDYLETTSQHKPSEVSVAKAQDVSEGGDEPDAPMIEFRFKIAEWLKDSWSYVADIFSSDQ